MTDIEQALAMIAPGAFYEINSKNVSILVKAFKATIEQREAAEEELADFKQKVSEFALGVREYMACCNVLGWQSECDNFIIPKPQPDPLLEIIDELDDGIYLETKAEYADRIRAALDARGLEIREKNDV